MKGIAILPQGKVAGIVDLTVPVLRDGYVLVKVTAIAVNPTDWKHIDSGSADPGARVGCEYAGIVEQVGSKVDDFKKGDRIAGLIRGCDRTNHENGAFAEYAVAKAALQYHIPEHVSDEEATTLAVSLATVGQGLYKSLKLPLPLSTPEEHSNHPVTYILIHAASTVVGMYGIQCAKASGLTVLATASLHNHDYLKVLGADQVYDYHQDDCAQKIREYTQGNLCYSWDCMGTGSELCARAMSQTRTSYYGTINPIEDKSLKHINPLTQGPFFTLAYDVLGEEYSFRGSLITPSQDEMKHAIGFTKLCERLLEKQVIKPIITSINRGGSGFAGALKGLDELRAGRVSGTKLAYTL